MSGADCSLLIGQDLSLPLPKTSVLQVYFKNPEKWEYRQCTSSLLKYTLK